jgi:hypothetical protein
VAKRLTICERRLVNSNRYGFALLLNFIGNKGVQYFDREWVGEATTLPGSFD